MKRTFLLLTLISLAAFVKAQNYSDISGKILLNSYKQAKDDIDKRMSNAKFISKPEAYILKTAIYAMYAQDSALAGGNADQYLSEADAAYTKYKEMDGPEYKLATEMEYKSGPLNLYSAFFSKGIKMYQAKQWEEGAQAFKKTAELSDFLIEKKVINGPIDTTSVLFAGFTAENAGKKDDAFKYYSRLADLKIGGADNDFIYRFLIVNSFQKDDMASFEKYRAIGKELYPDEEYYGYDKVDFAVGLTEGVDNQIKALEKILATEPNNYKALVSMAQFISDTLHPAPGDPMPSNAAELETKMINALTKASSLPESDELVYLVLGDNYIDKADKKNEERTKFGEEMRARTKPNAAPSKEDVAKRDKLDAEYAEAMFKALEPYEKAASLLAAKATLTPQQKQQYRKVAGYLGDIYNLKRIRANVAKQTADVAKFTAEAKKWNDLYDSIK